MLVGDEHRSLEDLRHHYEVEKAIATRLKQANQKQRETIYRTMYDELFAQVPNHSRLNIREAETLTQRRNERRMALVEKFISKDSVLLEFAPGDCRFASEMCKHVDKVYGVDISDQSGDDFTAPDNFKHIVYDGYHLDLPENSIDIVFSDQLLEHLHPEDTAQHMRVVHRILRPGGAYVFRTPHRFSGPWDISRYFADEPEGFHLKEWTYGEMADLLTETGYRSWRGFRYVKGSPMQMPYFILTLAENMLKPLPRKLTRRLSHQFHSGNITLAAYK